MNAHKVARELWCELCVPQITKDQICIVGDRLDTDVLWAERNGCGSLLVLTGGWRA